MAPPIPQVRSMYGRLAGATVDSVSATAVLRLEPGHGDVEVDGLFGRRTEAAVINLQAFGLPQTGMVDADTWTTVDYLAGAP